MTERGEPVASVERDSPFSVCVFIVVWVDCLAMWPRCRRVPHLGCSLHHALDLPAVGVGVGFGGGEGAGEVAGFIGVDDARGFFVGQGGVEVAADSGDVPLDPNGTAEGDAQALLLPRDLAVDDLGHEVVLVIGPEAKAEAAQDAQGIREVG